MPIYEHRCSACSHEWEEFYKMADPVPTICPGCKVEGNVKRLISAVKGRVEIQGRQATREWLTKQAQEAKTRARKDENYRANAIGEDRYQAAVAGSQEVKNNLKQF